MRFSSSVHDRHRHHHPTRPWSWSLSLDGLQLAVAECRPQARPLCERMLREREQQYERAKEKLEAATMGRAA